MNITLRHRALTAVAAVAAGALLAGCTASPRTRPLQTSPINEASNSTQAVRRQLLGKWTLVSLETYPSPGQVTRIQAVGELTYDAYGNLEIRAALTDVPSGDMAKLLKYSGRAVVDPPNHRLVLQAIEGQGGEALPASVSPENVRYYEFDKDLLKLTVKNPSGQPTAMITWKKAQ